DTALRNRLTGAVILVLLAVLLLPELLTGAGGTATRTSSTAGATSEGGAPLQTLQIDLSGTARGPAGSAPPSPEVMDGQAEGLDVDPAAPPPVVRLPVPEAITTAPPTAAPPAAAPPAAAPPAAARPTTAPPKAAPVDPTATRFYVQVGTFATRERAESARKDFTKRGFEVIINETTSGARRLHRVRIGPVADRAAAVALEARLRPLAPDRAIVAVPVAG
ncbi:MAG: SPOR domain-containing protein, partial [Xanthomonadales bacterium]|nr:SPOR domain-containing protein [Xanthomonadales bacterium]